MCLRKYLNRHSYIRPHIAQFHGAQPTLLRGRPYAALLDANASEQRMLPLSPAASAADECGGPEGPDDCSSTRFTCGANSSGTNSSGTNSSSNITGEGGKAESGQRNRARTLHAQVAVTYADVC